MTPVLKREKIKDTTGSWPDEERGKDWMHAATVEKCQGYQKLKKARKAPSFGIRGRVVPPPPRLRHLVCRTVRESIPVAISHPVCGTFLWQP